MMKSLIILLLVINIFKLASSYITREEYEKLRSKSSFQMVPYDQLMFKTEKQLNSAYGAILNNETQNLPRVLINKDLTEENPLTDDYPDQFDSRKQWPQCVPKIRNQSGCGSCFTYATTTALSNRLCIKTIGKFKNVFSVQDLISCDYYDNGCEGGNGVTVHNFASEYGIVLDSCKPYQSALGDVPKCKIECVNPKQSFKRCKVINVRQVVGEVAMKKEIFNNGPMYCGFKVMSDFNGYKAGIYKPTPGATLTGRHAVMVNGWGEDPVQGKYWIITNSWGTAWGEEGYFRFGIGVKLEMEENCVTADPDMNTCTFDESH